MWSGTVQCRLFGAEHAADQVVGDADLKELGPVHVGEDLKVLDARQGYVGCDGQQRPGLQPRSNFPEGYL